MVEGTVVGELVFDIALLFLLEVLLVAVREKFLDILLVLMVEPALGEVHIILCIDVTVVAVCVRTGGVVVEKAFEGFLLFFAGLLFSGKSHALWVFFSFVEFVLFLEI